MYIIAKYTLLCTLVSLCYALRSIRANKRDTDSLITFMVAQDKDSRGQIDCVRPSVSLFVCTAVCKL